MKFRARQLLLLIVFLSFVILLFNLGGWWFYTRACRYLDQQLGDKLKAIATTAALGLSVDLVASAEDPGALFLLTDYLESIQTNNQLETATVLNMKGQTLASTSHLFPYGAEDPAMALDRSAVALASSGMPSASGLYSVDGFFFKSGYAPVIDMEGDVAAILGVEASASYFQVLSQFRKTMLLLGSFSVLFIVAAGFLFFKLSYSLAQTEMAILRADALATMGRMAAHMAHEIRNPLSIIRGAVQRLLSSPGVRKTDQELLNFLPEEVDRLDEIVSRYLDFARVEPLSPVDVDLAALARETAAMAKQELAEKGVRLEIRAPEQMSPIRLDKSRVKQALLNLLLNAVQAMPEGGVVRVTVAIGKKWARLDVSDTGIGISKQDLNRIFQPFYTTKEKGSGLGLALVAKIVQDHRGRIQVLSQPNQGTTFSILLPLSQTRELGHVRDTGGG